MNKSEKLVLQDVWRKAAAMPEGVTIDCETHAAASQMRFALYNAVKSLRKDPSQDFELATLVETCIISYRGEKRDQLYIGPKQLTGLIGKMIAKLGINPGELESAEDKAVRESAERMLQVLGPHEQQPGLSQATVDGDVDAPFGYNPDGTPKKNAYY